MEPYEQDNREVIGWCFWCKEEIYEGEGHILVGKNLYHYDPVNYYKNCFYPEDVEG